MNFYSPLRYPGGKGKIADFIKLIFERNQLLDSYYVEPYAGGASVALSLLFSEYASKIIINDIDKSIYAFWYSVINETEELCKLIIDVPVNMEQWQLQRQRQKQKENQSLLELGFSTFYQNRTNRSGIIKAGVIGGINQNGNWKLDARYNKKDLVKRIQKIAQYKNRIILYNLDCNEFIETVKPVLPRKSLIYFDPPYYVKGKELYENHYVHIDHVRVAKMIGDISNQHWFVSYDKHKEIENLYSKFRQHIYSLNYSAAKPNQGQEVMIFSDSLALPPLFNNLNRSTQLSFDFI